MVIIRLGRDGVTVAVRSHALQYSIGQPIATTREKLNIQSQSRYHVREAIAQAGKLTRLDRLTCHGQTLLPARNAPARRGVV